MKKISKLLSVVLALVMIMSFAVVASAVETDNALTSVDELVSGEYYIVCTNGESVGTVDGTWITVGESVWTVTVTDNGVTLCDANGVYIAPAGGNKNGLKTNEYEWAVSCENGLFTFAGQGNDTVYLAFNSDAQYYKFRGYKTSTCTGDKADMYPSQFYLIPATSGGEDVVLPAGPVDCVIPGTLEYTFETDEAATAGVMFQWIATADGELGVAKMGENFMTTVLINDTYGEIGDYGYVVKTGDKVNVIVYAYGACSISVPVEYITAGGDSESTLGAAENPEILADLGTFEKTLESGEYFYQYTATAAGELTITTTGDGTHNMEVTVNGDNTKVYSNWDNDGTFITLTVAEGDVLTIKVYFDYPGAGTINFEMTMVTSDPVPTVPTIKDGRYVISWGELTFAALAEDKTYGYNPAGDLNNLTDADYVTITNVDGGFIIQDCYGRYVYMTGNYNSVNLSTELPAEGHIWTLVEAENGLMVMNVLKEKYLAYSEQYSSWGVYSSISETSVLTITAEVVEEPQPPVTGDAIFAVLSILAVSGMGITAVASKKH